MDPRAEEILEFWDRIGPEGWYEVNEAIDREIIDRWGELWEIGRIGVLRDWLFEFEPLQAGDDAQHWLLQLREADPRPEGGR